jgi:hypothetical protein
MMKSEIAMTRPYQPGQSVFRSILPEDIDWQSFPAFPPAVRLAVIVGHPSEPGPYVIRVKAPGGRRPTEGFGNNDEGQKEVRSDGRLGLESLGDPNKPLGQGMPPNNASNVTRRKRNRTRLLNLIPVTAGAKLKSSNFLHPRQTTIRNEPWRSGKSLSLSNKQPTLSPKFIASCS